MGLGEPGRPALAWRQPVTQCPAVGEASAASGMAGRHGGPVQPTGTPPGPGQPGAGP